MATGSLTEALRETLVCFDRHGTPRTTTEIADELDLGRRSTYGRLERLVESERLDTKKVGASARVWWRPISESANESTATSFDATATDSSLAEVLDSAAVGAFVLDDEFDIAWINDAVERYFGIDRDEVLGRDKLTVIDEEIALAVDDADRFTDTVRRTYRENSGPEQFECHVTPPSGESRWLEHRSKPIESGTYAGGRVELYYDITDRKRVERNYRDQRDQFDSLISAVEGYAIVALDAEGRVETWNDGAEAIMGYDRPDVFGEHVSLLYTDEQRAEGVPDELLERAAADGTVQHEGWRVRADGSQFWANTTLTARYDDGTLVGYTKITQDMTERRERERRHRRQRVLVDRLFETAPIRMATFHPDGSIERINSRAREQLGLTAADVASFTLEDLEFYDRDGEPFATEEHPIWSVIENEESVSSRIVQHDGPDGERRWISLTAAPLHADGELERILVVAPDVTDLKRTENQLSRERDSLERELDEVFDRIDDGVIGLDTDYRCTYVNDSAASMLETQQGEMLGRRFADVFPEVLDTEFEAATFRASETQEPQTIEGYYDPLDRWFEATLYPSATGLSVYFRDVTGRKERKQELERYEAIVETMNDGVYVVGEDGRFRTVNRAYADLTDYDRQALLGTRPSKVVCESTVDRATEIRDALAAGDRDTARLEATIQSDEGESVPAEATFSVIETDDGQFERVGVVRDISERRERAARRQRRLAQLEAIADLGQHALETRDLDDLMGEAVELVVETLGTDYCKILDLDADNETLHLREGVGWDEGAVGAATVSAVDDDSQAAYTLATDAPVRVDDLSTERRFSGPALLTDHDVRSGISVVIGSPADPWGVLGVHDTDPREFTDHDATFVQSVATVLATALSRHADEQVLVRQREQLAAINSLNRVVNEITGAVIERSTRSEIESTVCGHLADSDSYQFAWIGEPDYDSQTVRLRTEAGVDGYLDDRRISVDPDDDHGIGPTGRAIRTGTVQTTQGIQNDPRYEAWHETVRGHGVHASAAVPITHGDTVYGVLNLYTERPDAFEGEERTVIERLGDIVGHAIAATDRKRALMSDDIVELEFYIRDVFDTLDIEASGEGPVTLDTAVPVEDDEYLVYGTAPPAGVPMVEALVEGIPHWTSVRFFDDTGFELRLTEPPVLSVLAALGGRIDRAVIDDGGYHMALHVAAGTDPGPLIDAVTEAYPTAELSRRRQRSRDDETVTRSDRLESADLTDRQRAVLESAFHAGFFEWPRETSGEQLADSLGVSSPTFHQHLRKAEEKLLRSVLGRDATAQ